MQSNIQTQFKELIKAGNNILVISSEPLDLDTISSGLLTKKYIESLVPDKEIKLSFPRKLKPFEYELNAFVPFFELEFIGHDTRDDLNSGVYDTLVVLDGGSREQFYERNNRDLPEPRFNIKTIIQVDHHVSGEFPDVTLQIKDSTASSTTEILLDKIIPSDFLDEDLATLGYAGILGDTGNFRYGFTPKTMQIASLLLEKGARVTEILNAMYSRKTPEFLNAISYAINHIEFDKDTKTMFLAVSKELIEKDNLTKEQISLIKDAFKFDVAQSMRDYYRGIVLSEKIPGIILIECRGNHFKNSLNLTELLKHIGGSGGGHYNAAVATYNSTMEQGIDILKTNIKHFIDEGTLE